MIPEAPFLFSIAGLSASLAGLAGLVAALRRGADVRPIDAFRLREIVEFAFANVILAVGVIPASQLLNGGVSEAARIGAGLAIVYVISTGLILTRRSRHAGIKPTTGWVAAVVVLVTANVATAVVVLATGSIGWYEALLVLLLARPMLAFLLVLGSLESPALPVS